MVEQQRPKRFRSMVGPLKGLATAVVGLLLGIGFCGLDAHFHPQAEFGGGPLAVIGAALSALSVLGLVGSLLALIVVGLVRLFRS